MDTIHENKVETTHQLNSHEKKKLKQHADWATSSLEKKNKEHDDSL